MNKKTNYFKIGVFTLASITLVIIFCLLLGMGHLFQHSLLVETYFDESIQGLSIGSPVKYRGVNVGKITAIDMVNDVYGDEIKNSSSEAQRYIYVQFSLTQRLNHADATVEGAEKMIKSYVAKGFRASLATQDLVGNAFLSLNFVDDPKKAPTLPISWKPQDMYIPSTPSTLSQLTDTVSNIAASLNQVDFKKVIDDIDHLAISLDKNLQEAQIANLSEKMSTTLTETGNAMQQVTFLSAKINNALNDMNQINLNLSSFSDTLKSNPSALIFSQPTQAMDPSK